MTGSPFAIITAVFRGLFMLARGLWTVTAFMFRHRPHLSRVGR